MVKNPNDDRPMLPPEEDDRPVIPLEYDAPPDDEDDFGHATADYLTFDSIA